MTSEILQPRTTVMEPPSERIDAILLERMHHSKEVNPGNKPSWRRAALTLGSRMPAGQGSDDLGQSGKPRPKKLSLAGRAPRGLARAAGATVAPVCALPVV